MSITISEPFLENTIQAVIQTGAYQDISHLISDSLQALIREKKQLAIDVACQMYQQDLVSLGRACELAGIDMETLKGELNQRQIARTSDLSAEDVEKAVHREVGRYQQQ